MGIDVNLYAEGQVTDEELAAACSFLEHRVPELAWNDHLDRTLLVRNPHYGDHTGDTPRVELNTGSRYWGPGYERGPWPLISAAILAMRVALPQCQVFYGGDTSHDGQPADDEMLMEFWLHWLSPEGDAYRQR